MIRIGNRTEANAYVRRAIWLLLGTKGDEEAKPFDTIEISAIDSAITRALIVADVVRRRVPGIHQVRIFF